MFENQYPLSMIEKIEVLYGPASVLYGPNAFSGVVNVITNDQAAKAVAVSSTSGSYETKILEFSAAGDAGPVEYQLSYKNYQSDEADISDMAPWGYLKNEQLSDPEVWGPVLDNEIRGLPYGKYANPSESDGLFLESSYEGFKFGHENWTVISGYGPYYATDRAQSNQVFNKDSSKTFLEHEFQVSPKLDISTLLLYRNSRT